MPYTPEPIVRELMNYRRHHHITQERMAEILGCSTETVQKWEQGRARPGRMGRTLIMQKLQLPLGFGKGDEV